MNTYPRAATLEMPNDVLDDLRTRASVDERRVTAKMHALPSEGPPAGLSRLGSEGEEESDRAATVPAPLAVALRPARPTAPPTVSGHVPQRSFKRAIVIGTSFAITLAIGLAIAL